MAIKKKFYVTTPIYYPNDILHVGHAYTTIAADILARWNRLNGNDVFFLTGTDEHGKKIEEAAEKQNKRTKDFVDEQVVRIKEDFKNLNLTYDKFIRTTDKSHEKVVQEILTKVHEKGDIYLGKYEGLYCVSCEAYYTEKDLEEGNCPIHKKPVEILKEDSYFFKLSKYQKPLLELYKKGFILPKHREKEIVNRVKEGLKDLSISRTSFSWGIKMPFDKKHICYVWFDALTNYYSATREKGKDKFWPADVHLMGKDILWFHAVYWPAMLMSAGIEIPKKLFAHGWWTFDKEKISKSRGKVLNINELISIAGVDSARYFLFREAPFGADGDFSEKALIERHNNELADKLGNLVSRVSALIEKIGTEKVQLTRKELDKIDEIKKDVKGSKGNLELIKRDGKVNLFLPLYILNYKLFDKETSILFYANVLESIVEFYIDKYEFDKSLNEIFTFIDVCNEYVQQKKPWETKDTKVLFELKESILKIAELLWPFIPDTSEKIKEIFSAKKIKKGEVLFKKIDIK